jgi:uncharacterized protein YgiM (DUF1202 family)
VTKISSIPIITLLLFLSACQKAPASTPTATVTAPPTATATPVPPTATPTLMPTATITPTPTAFIPFQVYLSSANNANLRSGPGYLFPILRVLTQKSSLTLLGRSPGGEWYYLRVTETLKGWVFGKLLQQDPSLLQAPLVEPEGAKLIHGRVRDAAGTPISGISFRVVRRAYPNDPANVVVTDTSGEFFSYLPSTAGGVWTVSFTAVTCESNVWKGAGCKSYKAEYQGILSPPAMDVRLPQSGLMEFTLK